MDFIIEQVSWHTRVQGNPETREHIVLRFWAVTDFLQKNGLTRRVLASSIDAIDDDFALRSEDLTGTGMQLMRLARDPWLRKRARGLPPEGVTLLARKPAAP